MLGATYNGCTRIRQDYAITARIKREDKLINAQNYDRQLKHIGVTVDWNISQTKGEAKKMKNLSDKRIKTELNYTNEEIKLRRKEKLVELYMLEGEKYEEELNKRGLAIAKERY